MAAVEGGVGFWLPSGFFDDSLILSNKENSTSDSDSDFCFPKDFPYDFHLEMAPHFEKKRWAMPTSPQSTLTHGRCWWGSSNSSPNGAYAPLAAPLGAEVDAVGDLIYRTASQVARLKLNTSDTHDRTKHEVFMVPPRPQNLFHSAPKNSNQAFVPNIYHHIMNQQKQDSRLRSIKYNPARVAGPSATAEVVLGGGAASQRARAGTGVFLPRRYGSGYDSHADSRKKTGTAFVPERNVHAFNNTNGFAQSQPQCGSRGVIFDYDLLMARRNALMLQRHQSLLL